MNDPPPSFPQLTGLSDKLIAEATDAQVTKVYMLECTAEVARRRLTKLARSDPARVVLLLNGDANCLHCALAPVVEQFLAEHPSHESVRVAVEILQIAAEFIALTANAAEIEAVIADTCRLLAREVHRSLMRLALVGRPGAH
jgi:hypothetical protein